ncbi:TadE family type IV pilus minor pilin, partial [Streptomyces sp. NPDC057718]|uniref:TadE family type IV pilus minor pilin n=1 Tax=Streptomyces sp. NPDC057718 TaxID=3346225 RepID=UPI003687C12D
MTAEAAVVIPVLVAFAMALLWALTAVSDQIRCVDAGRGGARTTKHPETQTTMMYNTPVTTPTKDQIQAG